MIKNMPNRGRMLRICIGLCLGIEEMSSEQESELATLRAKLDRKGLAPPSTEAVCVLLRS